MKRSGILLTSVVLIATPSAAQSGPVAQKSPEQIVCELTGDCGPSDATATEEMPESRGFSIIRRPAASEQPAPRAAPQGNQANRATAPRTTRQPVRSAAIRRPSPAAVGRSDMTVSFVSGSAVLTDQARANVSRFVTALQSPALAGKRFVIEGHTDAVGGREYNVDLSRRRAQAVVDLLVASGADAGRFDVKGFGFDRPVTPSNPRASANRRVEIVVAK